MELLPVAAPDHRVHHDVLAGHEGQLLQHVLLNDLGVDHQAGGHVAVDVQDGVHRQEGLGDGDALVGGVVQGALKPLGGGGDGGVARVHDDVPGQGADALAAHGVALIGHGGGPDLVLLKGLLHLLQVAQQAHVGGKLAGGLGDAGQDGQDAVVHLPGVGLAAHRHHAVKAHLRGDFPLQLLHLLVVAVKQLQEGGLGAGGPLGAQQLQGGDAVLHLLQVQQQVVHPQGGPLAHGDQLGGLEVGEAQGGQGLVLPGELGQGVDNLHQLVADQDQPLPHEDHVGVVPHVAAGGPQVDDGHGLGAQLPVGVHVGHHVVAELLLPRCGLLVVNVIDMRLQLVHLLLGHRQAQLHLRPGQGHPQLPPGGELLVRGEQIEHLLAGVAGGQGAFIGIGRHLASSFSLVFQG